MKATAFAVLATLAMILVPDAHAVIPRDRTAEEIKLSVTTPPNINLLKQLGPDEMLVTENLFIGAVRRYALPGTETEITVAYSFPWNETLAGIVQWSAYDGERLRYMIVMPDDTIIPDIRTFKILIWEVRKGKVTEVAIELKNENGETVKTYNIVPPD